MPQQCPECGRFLKNDLVAALAQGDAPCPKCGRALTAEMFGIAPATRSGRGRRGRRAGDPLVGWDEGDVGSDRGGQLVIALEPDEALLAGIGGGILGALILREKPGIGALLGAFAGMVAGGLIRSTYPRR